jgi:hypothetical protein
MGLAICFPDTPVDESLTQDDMAGCVIGSESLPYLDRILPLECYNAAIHP